MTTETQRLYGRSGKVRDLFCPNYQKQYKRSNVTPLTEHAEFQSFLVRLRLFLPCAQQTTSSTTQRNGRAGLPLYDINQFLMKKQQDIKPSKITEASLLDFPPSPEYVPLFVPQPRRQNNKQMPDCRNTEQKGGSGYRGGGSKWFEMEKRRSGRG